MLAVIRWSMKIVYLCTQDLDWKMRLDLQSTLGSNKAIPSTKKDKKRK